MARGLGQGDRAAPFANGCNSLVLGSAFSDFHPRVGVGPLHSPEHLSREVIHYDVEIAHHAGPQLEQLGAVCPCQGVTANQDASSCTVCLQQRRLCLRSCAPCFGGLILYLLLTPQTDERNLTLCRLFRTRWRRQERLRTRPLGIRSSSKASHTTRSTSSGSRRAVAWSMRAL